MFCCCLFPPDGTLWDMPMALSSRRGLISGTMAFMGFFASCQNPLPLLGRLLLPMVVLRLPFSFFYPAAGSKVLILLQAIAQSTRQMGWQAYAVTLVTYLSLWWFGIFNPTVVYDHLGEIFSALIFRSFIFCIFLYIKGHLTPSSADSGSSGNVIIDFYWKDKGTLSKF